MDIIARFVTKHAGIILAAVLLLTAAAVIQIVDIRTGTLRLSVDPSGEKLLSEDDSAKQYYNYARRVFGSDETIVIAVESDDIFSQQTLELIEQLTAKIEQVDGVQQVISLTNALDIRGTEEGLDIAPFLESIPEDAATLASIRKRILENPAYTGSLVSQDGTAAALLVYLYNEPGFGFLQRIGSEIEAIVAETGQDASIWVTGAPQLKIATIKMLLRDLARVPPTVALLFLFLLLFFCRSVRGALVPLASVIIAVIWSLGTIALLGYTLNIVTMLIPPLLMILGTSYTIHVVAEYHTVLQELTDKEDAVAVTLGQISMPVLLTGVTTVAGFFALMLSPLAAVREFGLFAMMGVAYATIVALTFTPALLQFLGAPRGRSGNPQGKDWRSNNFDRMVERLARFDLQYRTPIFLVAGVIFVIALMGMTQIRVGTEHLTNFKPDSPVRIAYETVNNALGGANPFYIVFEADYRDAFKDPVNLRELEALQDWLEMQPEIGGTASIVDYLKLLNQAFRENEPAYHNIPDNRQMVGQLFFFGASEEIERFVDTRFQIANLVVRSRVIDSDDMARLVSRIEQRLEEIPQQLKVAITGNPVLVNRVIDDIIRGQVRSVLVALLIVYCLLAGLFLSFRIGFVAIIPNVLSVVAYFGALGVFGVSLNPSTSIIAPMVLGIAIDDTIHYFTRFSRSVRQAENEETATLHTLRVVGRPVTYTSVCLCLGFLVLTTSELNMQTQVGIMASFALAFAWLTDFVLTPALCTSVRFTTLWDCIKLDLGTRPQDSLSLLKGVSTFQARIVAHMMTIRRYAAGERLIHAGDVGREMFAVLDGELRTSIQREKGTVKLDAHTRGDTVGEEGIFYRQRTANVDVVRDVRLLVITQQSLEQLRRSYPRIAAKVFRNVNEIFALKLVHATDSIF